LPATIPDNADTVSPAEPVPPGTVPPLATPEALPPPAPPVAPIVTPAPVTTPYEVEGTHGYPVWIAKMGSAVMLGGGYEDFTQAAPKAQTADVTASDDIMTLPYGAGLMFAYGMFMADARATWRETYYNNMFRAEGSKLNTWGVGGNLGVEF
jgi:hypothetical protein